MKVQNIFLQSYKPFFQVTLKLIEPFFFLFLVCFFEQQLLAREGGKNLVGEEVLKKRKMDIKLESEDANFAFSELQRGGETKQSKTTNGVAAAVSQRTTNNGGAVGKVVGVTRPRPAMGVLSKRPPPAHQGPVTLTSQLREYWWLATPSMISLNILITPVLLDCHTVIYTL